MGLRYLVFGAAALTFHRISRSTDDIYIWIDSTVRNLEILRSVFMKMGYEDGDVKITSEDMHLPQMWRLAGPMDILTNIHKSFDFDICYSRKSTLRIDSLGIDVLHLIDVRDLKVRAKRDQDLRDVIIIDNFLREHGLPSKF